MAIEDFFDHTCDIYHVTSSSQASGYGLPAADAYSYPAAPDVEAVLCHFSLRAASNELVQNEPQTDLISRVKVSFPAGTDIRINDKLVWLQNGLEYRMELPMNIRDHHMAGYAQRRGKQAAI